MASKVYHVCSCHRNCCCTVALYSNMGVALRQFVLYGNTLGIGLSFINTAAADTCVSCPFAQMYLSGRDMFKRSSFLYSSSSGTFTASTVNPVGGS